MPMDEKNTLNCYSRVIRGGGGGKWPEYCELTSVDKEPLHNKQQLPII